MKVWLLQISEPLPLDDSIVKMRTAMLADKLAEQGHEVLWWASAFDHFKKKWYFRKDTDLTLKNGVKIKALKGLAYKKNLSLIRYLDHRIIALKFRRLAPKMPVKPDIIVASTPSYDSAYEATIFAKKNNIPILIDIRDEWPEIFLGYFPKSLRKIIRLIFYWDFCMFGEMLRLADGLIAMMGAFIDWGLGIAQRPLTWKDRVFYIGQKKDLGATQPAGKIAAFKNRFENKFVVTFLGTMGHNNNPIDIINCASILKEEKILFVLAGDGPLFGEIKNKSLELSNVLLTGWLNQGEIKALIKLSHVGICPTDQVRDALPNKVSLYFSAGLPVISAFSGEIKSIIEKYEVGFFYPPNEVKKLVECLMKLYKDKSLYTRSSDNAKRIFDQMFDADKIYAEYAKHIEKIVQAASA